MAKEIREVAEWGDEPLEPGVRLRSVPKPKKEEPPKEAAVKEEEATDGAQEEA